MDTKQAHCKLRKKGTDSAQKFACLHVMDGHERSIGNPNITKKTKQ